MPPSADADRIADLHADSWRRFYRGAYADSFLDGDVVADRRAVWSQRLATPPANGVTILAETEDGFAGFVHVVINHDEWWGSLIDNLHVSEANRRTGIGSALIIQAAQAVVNRGATNAMYLWVLEQNSAAQAFYSALGGRAAERALVPRPAAYRAALPASPPACDSSGATPAGHHCAGKG